jgi:hypothetical protein
MSRDPRHLHPIARSLDERLAVRAAAFGITTKLIETYRDNTAQMEAWRKGRNEHGSVVARAAVVTWKRPGDSLHNLVKPDGTPCSLAFHRAIVTSKGLLGFGESLGFLGIEMYKVLGRIGISLGLRWGGDWDSDGQLTEHGENDFCHFEKVIAPLGQVKAALLAGQDIVDLRRA